MEAIRLFGDITDLIQRHCASIPMSTKDEASCTGIQKRLLQIVRRLGEHLEAQHDCSDRPELHSFLSETSHDIQLIYKRAAGTLNERKRARNFKAYIPQWWKSGELLRELEHAEKAIEKRFSSMSATPTKLRGHQATQALPKTMGTALSIQNQNEGLIGDLEQNHQKPEDASDFQPMTTPQVRETKRMAFVNRDQACTYGDDRALLQLKIELLGNALANARQKGPLLVLNDPHSGEASGSHGATQRPSSNTRYPMFAGTSQGSEQAIIEITRITRQLQSDSSPVLSEGLAKSLSDLGFALCDLGWHEQALSITEWEVAITRALSLERPTAFEPTLAGSLHNLSIRLSDVGRREEALKASEESVEIQRRLAQDRPLEFGQDLARSLSILSNHLRDLGQDDEALEKIEESVQIYRALAKDHPQEFQSDLAQALNNLSIHLGAVGQREEALEAIEVAVEIDRVLVQAQPSMFAPDLGVSLNNLSLALSNLGRREEALTAIEEAVHMRRKLVQAQPNAFKSDIATSLNHLSFCLDNLGRKEEALCAIEEVVEIRQGLVKSRPGVYELDLVDSLIRHSLRLCSLGRKQQSLYAIEEATGHCQRIGKDRVIGSAIVPCLQFADNRFRALGWDDHSACIYIVLFDPQE